MDENKVIEDNKKKIVSFLKTKYAWISYILLAVIVYLSIRIRTANLSGLRDITTGGWTLGPDLDPFLFLRWARYIVENGSLFAMDSMRYVPLGYDTRAEMVLLSYMIAWFHKVASIFGSTSIEQSAALFPVFMFALTVIAFFFFVRKLFVDSLGPMKSNIIALISSFFLTVIPSLLPRTIAGIPEKESAAFLFIFLSFYFFISAWKSRDIKYQIFLTLAAGVSTAIVALLWGGFIYVFLTIGLGAFIAFLIGQASKNHAGVYAGWLISSCVIMAGFSSRYTFGQLLNSTTTLAPIIVFVVMALHFILYETKMRVYLNRYTRSTILSKIPSPFISLFVAGVFGVILGTIAFGPMFLFDKLGDFVKPLINPVSDRIGITVAENRQPFFSEWASSFGPSTVFGPVFFWIFMAGSVYLYARMMNVFSKKERVILTAGYIFFILALVFSKYSQNSVFSGTNWQSVTFYFLGILVLVGSFGFYYYKYYNSGQSEKLKAIDFSFILLFAFFFLSIVSARSAVRLIMVLVPSAAIMASYLVVVIFDDFQKSKGSNLKNTRLVVFILLVLALLYSGYFFYSVSNATASTYVPSVYTFQWQGAMDWVRENTPTTAVFAHWWDYGYWVQTMGNRSTVLDGGNAIAYWDYLMGRYALTAQSSEETLPFLYSHNATHLLIDSSDIGKYPAFSSIGSDINYDRYSWINTFVKDTSQTVERRNSTLFVYQGGMPLDADVIYTLNGTTVFLPEGSSGVGAVLIERDSQGRIVQQPSAIFVSQGKQYTLPLRYIYHNGLVDYGSGINAGVFIVPSLSQTSSGYTVQPDGALLFLTNRTINSRVARLYLFNEEDPYFKLVHSEDDFLVKQLKSQQQGLASDFIYYGGLRGPIRIWNINYPEGMSIDPILLQVSYPDPALTRAK